MWFLDAKSSHSCFYLNCKLYIVHWYFCAYKNIKYMWYSFRSFFSSKWHLTHRLCWIHYFCPLKTIIRMKRMFSLHQKFSLHLTAYWGQFSPQPLIFLKGKARFDHPTFRQWKGWQKHCNDLRLIGHQAREDASEPVKWSGFFLHKIIYNRSLN